MVNCPGEITLTLEQIQFQVSLGHITEIPKNDNGLKYKLMFEIDSHETIRVAICYSL